MKDAKGHGSNSRGGGFSNAEAQNLYKQLLPRLGHAGAVKRVAQTAAMLGGSGLKPRPPEGNPFPKSYRQHELWERDHMSGEDHVASLASQHNIPIGHLSEGAKGLQDIHNTIMANLPKGVTVTHSTGPIGRKS